MTLMALAIASVSCSAAGSSADPAAVLRDAGTALGQVRTAAVELKFGPGATFFNLTVVSASGKVKLPDASTATIKAKQASDSLIELQVTTVDGHTYVLAPFIGVQELTGEQAAAVPSVGRIFDAKEGLPAILGRGRNPTLDGSDTIAGVDCWRVKARYGAAEVAKAVQPLNPTGDIDATLWVGKNDHLLRKVLLKGNLFNSTDKKSTTLEVRLHDFNSDITIAKPA